MDPLKELVRAVAREVIAELMPHLAGASDEVLDRAAVEARYPFRFRIVTDAARRDELVLEHAGRKPVVRRSVLEKWIATRRRAQTTKVEAETPREAGRRAAAEAASKLGRRSA